MELNNIKEENIEEIADSEAVLERGINYFHSGRVRRIWLEGEIICASVIGSGYNDYTTKVWCTDDGLEWKCNCPYEGWCCKHVIALLYTFIKQREKLLDNLKDEDRKITALGDQLTNLSKEDLIKIILGLTRKNKSVKINLLEMLEEYPGCSDKDFIHPQKYDEYWGEIDPILDEFNEYGGGPEEGEEIVYINLDKIVSLFEENRLPHDTKTEFIDNLFHYYDWDNSGLEDALMDAVFDVANSESDWKYVIEKLRKNESDWRKSLIMQIYRDHLHDEESYLREREAKLRYGMDYHDLSQFWYGKGDIIKAVEIAKEGLKKGEGRVIDLIEFLFEYYENKKDYKNALKYAIRRFDDDPSYSRYKELERFCKKNDWMKTEAKCLDKLRNHHREGDLVKIHLDKKEYDKVLKYVLSKGYLGFFDDREKFADKLKDIYPKDILRFYKERVQQGINRKNRRSYREAAGYARKIKHIYTHVLRDVNGWDRYLHSTRNSYQKYPALQDEFSGL